MASFLARNLIGIMAGLSGLVFVFFLIFPLGVAGDFPNHLAKAYIETRHAQSEFLSVYYDISWRVVPHLASDAIIYLTSPLIGIYKSGALVLTLAVILLPLAGSWLSKTLHGPSGTWLPLLGWIAAFNFNLELGFTSYMISAGLALFAYTLWIRIETIRVKIPLFMAISVVLALAHALGFLLLGYLVLWREIGRIIDHTEYRKPAHIIMVLGVMAACFSAGLLIVGLGAMDGHALQILNEGRNGWMTGMSQKFFSPFVFNGNPMVLFSGLLILITFISLLCTGLLTNALKIHPELKWVMTGMLGLVMIMPDSLFGIWGLHIRFTSVLMILVLAGISIASRHWFWRTGFPVLAVCLIAIRLIQPGMDIIQIDRFQSHVQDTSGLLPEGARLLVVHDPDSNERLTNHAGMLAVIETNAYVPGLFTNTSLVDVDDTMSAYHFPAARVEKDEFLDAANQAVPTRPVTKEFFHGWPQTFTHILYFHTGDAELVSPYLCSVRQTQDLALYRVKLAETAC